MSRQNRQRLFERSAFIASKMLAFHRALIFGVFVQSHDFPFADDDFSLADNRSAIADDDFRLADDEKLPAELISLHADDDFRVADKRFRRADDDFLFMKLL